MTGVAITGLGAVAPNGSDKEEFWQALKNGVSGTGPVTRFDPSGMASQVAGEVKLPLTPPGELFAEDLNSRSLTSKLIISAAIMALNDAGFSREGFSRLPSVIWVGTSTTDMKIIEEEYDIFRSSRITTPDAISASFPHAAASEIGTELKCLGPVVTVSIGCSSGLFSIISAAEAIATGEADIALAGGGDAPISPILYAGFCSAGLLTTAFNRRHWEACRPFDADRDGGVLSEGAGMVVLENAQRALAQGKKIYGYLTGWGKSNAYSHQVMTDAFALSMVGAIRSARLVPSEVDYINANAPGDKYIDAAEMRAIKRVFAKHAYNLPISSIKSSIGNPLAAAGPLQLIASLMAMNHSFVPPTINLHNPKPQNGLDLVPLKGRVARLANVLVNTQGLGGNNVTAVLSVGNPQKERA